MAAEPTFTTARVRDGVVVERALHRQRLLSDGGDPSVVDELLAEADDRVAALTNGMVRVVVGEDRARSSVDAGPARRQPWKIGDPPLSILLRADPRTGESLRKKTVERRELTILDEEARALGADGVVLTGPNGELREGTWFSLLLFLDGEWCAPPVGDGVLFSTTRAAFERSLAAHGRALVTRTLTPSDLESAEAALALSALLGASAIWRVGDVVLERSAAVVEPAVRELLGQSLPRS